jgi:sulfatase maturation enzyme AslB (radical SAM superfamily)
MWGMKKYYSGHISDAHPLSIEKVFVNDLPCTECEIFGICGGRCLYANITKRWSNEAYAEICTTVKGLIKAVKTELPRIERLIHDKKVSLGDFEYVRYNGCEIIP